MPSDAIIAQLLADNEAAYQQAKAAYQAATAARETAIRAAHESDWSVRRIASELGVSFQLIGRIVGRDRAARSEASDGS